MVTHVYTDRKKKRLTYHTPFPLGSIREGKELQARARPHSCFHCIPMALHPRNPKLICH